MAMQSLGEIRDVSLEEPIIDDIIKRVLRPSEQSLYQHRSDDPAGSVKVMTTSLSLGSSVSTAARSLNLPE